LIKFEGVTSPIYAAMEGQSANCFYSLQTSISIVRKKKSKKSRRKKRKKL